MRELQDEGFGLSGIKFGVTSVEEAEDPRFRSDPVSRLDHFRGPIFFAPEPIELHDVLPPPGRENPLQTFGCPTGAKMLSYAELCTLQPGTVVAVPMSGSLYLAQISQQSRGMDQSCELTFVDGSTGAIYRPSYDESRDGEIVARSTTPGELETWRAAWPRWSEPQL